jgi:hypothetical protein
LRHSHWQSRFVLDIQVLFFKCLTPFLSSHLLLHEPFYYHFPKANMCIHRYWRFTVLTVNDFTFNCSGTNNKVHFISNIKVSFCALLSNIALCKQWINVTNIGSLYIFKSYTESIFTLEASNACYCHLLSNILTTFINPFEAGGLVWRNKICAVTNVTSGLVTGTNQRKETLLCKFDT